MQPEEFLRGLYEGVGGGFIEIRPFPEGNQYIEGQNRKWFAWPAEVDTCGAHCRRLSGQMHVYFGVGLRNSVGGGKKSDVGCVTAVFADIDFKDVPRDRAHGKLQSFPLRPSACVRSGGGIHVYWFLKQPVFASKFDRLEAVNYGILLHVGAQVGTQNADRILRVPGTANIKACYSHPKPTCEVSWWNPNFRYTLDDFDFIKHKDKELFTPQEPSGPRPAPNKLASGDLVKDLAKILAQLWTPGLRNYLALHLAGWCAHAGLLVNSTIDLVREVCSIANDEEVSNRVATVIATYQKYVAGEPVTGKHLFYDFIIKNFPKDTQSNMILKAAIFESYLSGLDVAERKGCLTQKNS